MSDDELLPLGRPTPHGIMQERAVSTWTSPIPGQSTLIGAIPRKDCSQIRLMQAMHARILGAGCTVEDDMREL